jgi:hypothetical protein
MNKAGKRKHLAPQTRHTKALYLPMERSAADHLVLRVRIALESIRRGHADSDSIVCLAEVVLLAGFLTEAGHGRLDQSVLDETEKHLLAVLDNPDSAKRLGIQPELLDTLITIVNEYDRILRESRLLAIVEANDCLKRLSSSAICFRRTTNV